MRYSRTIITGDLLALCAFALLGLASHEHEVTAAALARTFLPFAVAWLAVGAAAGMFRPSDSGRPVVGLRLLAAYLAAAVLALAARSTVFDRMLFSAFFVIALVGNGLLIYVWRAAYGRWLGRRSTPARIHEVTRT